jgi:iron-sulfur cluster repair protein YtfE (RIC family)
MPESVTSQQREIGAGSPTAAHDDLWRIEPSPEGTPASPLDLIFVEHLRQREAAQIMSLIADGVERARPDQCEIYRRLGEFLSHDLLRHTVEEETVFFPILREFCEPEDDIERVLTRLSEEHERDRARETGIRLALQDAAEGGPMDQDSRRKLRDFAEHLRQHIALEDAIVLPIAQTRFDPRALARLDAGIRLLRAARTHLRRT